MSDWKEHAKDCQDQLGNPWYVVHHWLDEFAKIYWPAKVHRIHRHNKSGVEEVRHKWGDEAAEAAEIHILKDEGDIPTMDEIARRYGVTNYGVKNEKAEAQKDI
jgi:hypothetical protein